MALDYARMLVKKIGFSRKEVESPEEFRNPTNIRSIPKAVEMKQITKRFPGVLANDRIDFEVNAGEIHALLGENGAGKTTLMNILYGLYQPDEGEIFVHGKKTTIKSPKDAILQKIGMVHQHFMLIPSLTVTENIILGLRSRRYLLETDKAGKKILEMSRKYGLNVNPKASISKLSVGEQQRVEIIKALYREADILILDEPTSVLTPVEVEPFFTLLKCMAKDGCTIIIITHKLDEVLAVSDRATVLRNGKVVSTVNIVSSSKESLSKMMFGDEIPNEKTKRSATNGEVILEVKNLCTINDQKVVTLDEVSFSVHSREILGIAGVSGNGQKDLMKVVTGMSELTTDVCKIMKGNVRICGRDIKGWSPKEIIEQRVARIPEERFKMGLIEDFSIAENLISEMYSTPPLASKWLLNYGEISQHAEELISEYSVKTPSIHSKAKTLSGGNQQRLILARELSISPKLIVASQPTRGLDTKAMEFIHRKFLEQRENGVAILLVSEDLEEILTLSDRIAVMYKGKIVKILSRDKTDINEMGQIMTGAK